MIGWRVSGEGRDDRPGPRLVFAARTGNLAGSGFARHAVARNLGGLGVAVVGGTHEHGRDRLCGFGRDDLIDDFWQCAFHGAVRPDNAVNDDGLHEFSIVRERRESRDHLEGGGREPLSV